MSGQQPPPNQTPRGVWNRADQPPGAASSPIQFRPPSPWAPSPPPIISGPRFGGPASNRSTTPLLSPMFGAPAGQRGTRGPQITCPRPQWPQQRAVSPNNVAYQQQQPLQPHSYSPFAFGSSPGAAAAGGRLSPHPQGFSSIGGPGAGATASSGPKPFYRQNTYSPTARASPIICQTPGTPPEFLYSGAGGGATSQQQYDYRQPSPQHQQLHQQFVGAPLDPPVQPKSYVIYDDDEEQGPSTAEIIANQSQDYVDERLAEYQMTIFQLQEEQERVQKKTFVNWINSYLLKRVPPLRIADLIHDLRDGTKLLALLEVLSGEKLPMEKGRVLRRPHFLSNANTALQYLASKRIKLVNINPADLVDGRPPVVLGLIWTIILYFQIEENSRALEYLGHGIGGSVSSLDSVSFSSTATTSAAANVSDMKAEKWKQGARKTLLTWVTNALPKDSGVEVKDFGASWRDGVAFLALIDAIKANLINLAEMKKASNKQRLETAFDVAESKLGIARLLDAEDVDVEKPDEKSIMTYVAQFLHKYPEPKGTSRDGVSALQEDYAEFAQWLQTKTTHYDQLIRTQSFSLNFADYTTAKAEVDGRLALYNKIKTIVESHHSQITLSADAWQEIDSLWHKLQIQLMYWLWRLDGALPGDFGVVGRWLAEAEKLLFDDEIPAAMNEETASIISRKLEEHKQFFAGYEQMVELFRQAKQSAQLAGQVPDEQLRNLEQRLVAVGPQAAQRRIRLKFLEHKCCLIAFMSLVETKLRQWTVKYGREPQAVQMLEQYKNFVSRNKIFQEFSKAFVDMQHVVVEYKRDGNVPRAEAYDIDQFLRDTEEKWKTVSTELRCCQNMLEESVAHWRRWNETVEPFAEWLQRAEEMLQRGTEDDRLEFFQDISVWKDRHQVLAEAVQFLVATCTEDIAHELRNTYAQLSGRFETLFAHTSKYMHAGDLLRNRQDYRAGAEKVAAWLQNADAVLGAAPVGSVDQIKAYGEQLQTLAAEIDDIDEVFKSTSRIIQAMVPDLSRDDVDRMLGTLKQQKEALVRVRAQIPVKLHMFHQLLTQQESLEQGQKDINQWLNDGEELLQSLSLAGGKDQVNEQLTRHRNFFSRTLYYKSMLESKNKVFQNLLKSAERVDSATGAEAVQRMQLLNDRFAYVTQNAQQWEQRLKEAGRSWQNFKEAERVVSEWLSQAEILLAERHVESKQAIETQKMFFDNVNERWMSDLVVAAQALLQALPQSEHQPIVAEVERLQTKWTSTLSAAHLHVVRLEFRLEESNFTHYIKDVEKEIHLEQQALNKNEDIDSILRRNQDYFKNRGTIVAIEHSLRNMERIQLSYAQFAPAGDEGLSGAYRSAEQQWERVAHEIDAMRTALQQIPAQWEHYHAQFAEMQTWMDVVDESLKSIIKEVDSMDEFERERVVFQNICQEADAKREHMKWLVKTLDSLLPYATPTEAENEQKSLESLIARYKNLIPTIEVTMVKTEVFSKCYTYRREVHEVVCLLNKVKDQTVNAPAPDSLDRVNKMIQEQQYAISQLDHQRTHIMSMLQRGRDLSKDVHAPAFVGAEVRTLETGWNEAYNETVDKLKSLKGTQTVWSDFHDQKQSIVSLLGTAEGELRSITPLQTDPKNVSSDLKNKRELNVALQSASQQMIGRLHELCGELVPLTDPTKRPVLEREVTEIEKQFFNTMEHVKDRVSYLEDYSTKWNSYKARLAELQAWAAQTAPQLIEAIQSEDISPEERVAKATALRSVISEKMRALDMLGSDASELSPKEGNFVEAKRLKGEVFKLQETLSAINRNVDHQTQAVKEDLVNWQKYQTGIQQIRPWIEQSETRSNFVNTKPTTLQEAVQLQKQAAEFEAQCDSQLHNLHDVASISNQMSCKTNAPDELDAVHSRWSAVHENARQVTGKFERLVSGWQSFDTDMSKLEQWVGDNERAIGKRPVLVNTPYVEKLEKELAKLKLHNNEISEKQAKLVSLTQAADQICQAVSAEGATAIKERVGAVKAQTAKLSETVRGRINDVSDAIMSRQDFNARMANFGNWMAQLRAQMVTAEELSTDRVDHVLHAVHGMLQEHQDKQPSFKAIYEEVKQLTASATPEECLIINSSYTTLVGQYEDIERELQLKKAALEKWNEIIGWRNETDSHVTHIRQQLEKPGKIEVPTLSQIVQEIEQMTATVEQWKPQVRAIDDSPAVHLKDSSTRKPLNATQLVADVENQLQALHLKSQGQMNVLNKMEQRKDHFTQLQNNLVQHLQANRQRLHDILSVTPDFSNIDQIISDLVALNEAMNSSADMRGKIHEEGAILMRDDVASMPAIQESMLVLDKEWDGLQQEIADRIQKYTIISQGLKEYAEAKERFRKDIGRANDIIASVPSEPAGEQQLMQTADKTKRALEQIKKSKGTLDDYERRGQAMLTLFGTIEQTIPNDIARELTDAHNEWQQLHDQISRNAHIYETEAVIWNQIEDNKNELQLWLSETNQSLCDAADNTLEIEFGPIRLNKYESELPTYAAMHADVQEKIKELQTMNNGAPIPALQQLDNELEQQFRELADNAQRLQAIASTFETQEKDLRAAIKASGETITKLRETLIKCDDMSGDNTKIMQRLQSCSALKEQLIDVGSDVDNLRVRVDEMRNTYPTFAESIIPKELSNTQKRYDAVLIHATKVERTLLQFLNKFHTDKVGMLQRMIRTQRDKIAWCVPEPSSDRYNLEVKKASLNDVQKGIAECETRQMEVVGSMAMLQKLEQPDTLAVFGEQIDKIAVDLNELRQTYAQTCTVLDGNIDLWNQYETNTEQVGGWLKDIEAKVKAEASNQIELQSVDKKLADLEEYAQNIAAKQPEFNGLEQIAKKLTATNSEARVEHFVSHLAARYQTVAKNVAHLLEHVRSMHETHAAYEKNHASCKEWIYEARLQLNELARMGSPGSGPTVDQLGAVKTFVKELANGQLLLNGSVDTGESLYSAIVPENREQIRQQLRELHESFDHVHDEATSLLAEVESVLLQKNSIEESYSQVKQWLSESQAKFETVELYPNLSEKKSALQKFRAQLQDNILHRSALTQLQNKATSLYDEEAEQRVASSIQEYDALSKHLNERIATAENHVVNHQTYDQILEKSQDWLTVIKAKAIDFLNEATFEKEGAEEKLIVVENMIQQKPEGEKIFAACQKQLETVLLQTHPSGHPALINGFEAQRKAWDDFINLCEVSQTKLQQLCSKWDEFDSVIDALDGWLKQTENVVKDQSLKSTWETKAAHLKKLQQVNGEIDAKAADITKIVQQGHEIEGETDLNLRVSRLNTRYQTLKNICRESIAKYETFARDHKSFNDDYEQFKTALQKSIAELEANSEIVGDLNLLQQRQQRIREMSDNRINNSTVFEALLDRGEKLYAHTSPDGREVIRQQLRNLRTSWDNLTDDLNAATQRIDQCLLQFGEFTVAQEQLAKWLRDVEKAMQAHTELKPTLQEKRAQLQNHKLMHQEIMTHNVLVDSVCDKAQHLVDQTKDVSLNVYLTSIKSLFADIVSKSQDLLENLEGSAQAHHNFNVQVSNLKSWLNEEREKLLECDDTTGEKNDINRKLNSLTLLKKNREYGDKLLKDLVEQYDLVKVSTAPKGVDILDKELNDIRASFNNHFAEIDTTEAKQKATLQHWSEFDRELDELTKWCRSTEAIFRDQPLQSSIEDKLKQLAIFKQNREQIIQKQKSIDHFMDQTHSLLNNSGADRIKTLISQLTNRYQLLQVLSKEVVNRWQSLCDDHQQYADKLIEVNAWMGTVQTQLSTAEKEDPGAGTFSNLLQILRNEREQAEPLLSALTTLGEKALPETSTQGREKIRQELRQVRERWDAMDEAITALQKRQEAQTMQWSSYTDILQQTQSWLETMEHTLSQENPNTWTSPQEIRSKLFKYKATAQEIASHKRIIESVNEKAQTLIQSSSPTTNVDEVKRTIEDINKRYEQLGLDCGNLIGQLDEAIDVYQQFIDLQKSQQDHQKNLWDRLAGYSDYSGSKPALQVRLAKVTEIQDALPEGTLRLKNLANHVELKTTVIPVRCKEAMSRDLTNLNVDFERFGVSLSEVQSALVSRLQQWTDYEQNLDRLITWLNDAENSLKNFAPKSTLEEKQEQFNKFQALLTSLRDNENDFDKMTDDSAELIQSSGETRISVNVQQVTSRFQSIQSTAKEIVKKSEQALADHQAFAEKYKQCSNWVASAQDKFNKCLELARSGARQDLLEQNKAIQELLAQYGSATLLLNNTVEMGERLYPSTGVEGREHIRQQLQDLTLALEQLYDNVNSSARSLDAQLNKWSGFEECADKLQQWLLTTETHLPAELQLHTTLDEKRHQLQVYRDAVGEIQQRQADVINLKDIAENLPERNDAVDQKLRNITEKYDALHRRGTGFVERYEQIVSDHQQYCKAVMDTQEFIESTHNTVDLWGDLELERVSLSTNLDRLRNLQRSLSDDDEVSRIDLIRRLGEKVIPGTVETGQVNIQSQIDCSQQEWEGLLSLIQSTVESIEAKLQQWDDFEKLKEQCSVWIRDTDNRLHSIDLRATNAEKKEQLEELKGLQGEVRARELEIDNVSEKAQQLYRGLASARYSQASDLMPKYQQVSHKVKELNSRWQQYVTAHQEFDNQCSECAQWLDDIKEKLEYCSDLSATSQKDLEGKLATIQDLLLLKDEGFAKVQSIVELAQTVLANTAPHGHEPINSALAALQAEWSTLALQMVDIKSSLGDSINQWSGFLEQVQAVNKTVEWLDAHLKELSEFQTSMTEKRTQLERIRATDEKVRLEKIDVDTLKAKAAEMLASGQQSQAAYQAQQILDKFDYLADKVKKLLADREEQYRDHRLYKEAYDDLIAWISRAREKVPSMKQRSLSDKLAIENAVAPLDALLNKQAQGELLVEHLIHTGEVVIASTSTPGQEILRADIRSVRDSFEGLFREVAKQKEALEVTLFQWRDYKEEYERLSEWLQQIDILVKNHKLALLPNLEEKQKQVKDMRSVLDRLVKGQSDIDKFNASAAALLTSHLDTYVNNQLRHLNSRYQVQVNLAKDVMKKVETNHDQHAEYNGCLKKARAWIENAREVIRESSDSASVSNKDVLQQRLNKIQDLIRRREDGQSLVHTTVNNGEKVVRNTRSDGKETINNEIKELQTDWDRLVKKMSTAKVHLETSLLQWADYSSSYSQLQQWISDREIKLKQVCDQKVAKSKQGQPSLSSGLSERKANLRQTNNIVQDIVSFEPMIQSVTSKASNVLQATPASEISTKYESLTKQAKDLYEKQKEAVEQHQSLIDAENEFAQWLRNAKERLSKCAEPTGDKDALSTKLIQLTILESEVSEGQEKLNKTLEQGEIAVQHSEPEDKVLIEEAMAFLQDEFDNYVDTLKSSKNLLEIGIVKWTEYDDQYCDALEWLNKTESLVQTFNKLQESLEDKKCVLEQFQVHLQTLFDWQKDLDRLNVLAQSLLETCADTRISNAVTQLTTKYNALLSLAKEIMRRLELHYQEHQQHHSLYEECQYWLENTREKLNDCEDIPSSLTEVQIRLNTVKGLRQGFEQGQNKLRYAIELKEKVCMNTEPQGAAKIQEDTENLKTDFEKLLVDINDIRTKLANRASQLEDIFKQYKNLTEWLEEIEPNILAVDSFLNELSEKRAALEKFRALQREIHSHNDTVEKINQRLDEDSNLKRADFAPGLQKFDAIQQIVNKNIENIENQVNNHELFKLAFNEIYDWIRKTRLDIQQCSDSHGEKPHIVEKLQKLQEIDVSMPEGKILMENAIGMSQHVIETSGAEGQDSIQLEIQQLRGDWSTLEALSREAHDALNACIAAWNNYVTKAEKINAWIDEMCGKVARQSAIENKTPEELVLCKQLLADIVAERDSVEDLNDVCEVLMEHSACTRVRDQTVETQANYTKLLTSVQGLVSKVEKNLSDHTEFLNYKNEMDKWLAAANETLDDCSGVGDVHETQRQVDTVNSLASRIPEGQHLLGLVTDAFTKATNLTPDDKQDTLRHHMTTLRQTWETFTMRVQDTTVMLKAALSRWEDYIEAKQRLDRWLKETEDVLSTLPETRGELSEMKTMLERYRHLHEDIAVKRAELDHLASEVRDLSFGAKAATEADEIHKLQARWERLNGDCAARMQSLQTEVTDYQAYHTKLQEAERWLLQVSFQLMAHNSLYITNREQTLEQITQHELLLSEIQKYQTNLDDLRASGQSQIERYVRTTPTIRVTIESQLRNIQDSYNSLLNTSVQIRNRLHESLAKFQEYENTIDSIMQNLATYEPVIAAELDEPATNLEMAQAQLKCATDLHTKLQSEKARLAVAVQACEAATASISRPSSPLESALHPIPERELIVRAKLEDLIDQVQSHLSGLSTTVSELEQQQKQRSELTDWIKKQQVAVTDWASRPSKLRPETAKQELATMNDLLVNVGDKRSQLMTEMTGTFSDDDTTDIEQLLDILETDLMDTLARKTSGQNIIDTYRAAIADMHTYFDVTIKRADVLDRGSGLNSAQKLASIVEIKNEFDDQGPVKMTDLRQKAHDVTEIISNLDGQQVEEQLKSIERRYNDVSKRLDRKAQVFEVTNRGVDGAKGEIAQIQKWVHTQIEELQAPQTLGAGSKSAESRLARLKALTKEADAKQALADTLEKRVANMKHELEPLEHTQLETELRNLHGSQKQLADLIRAEIAAVGEASQTRKKFENDLDKARQWLKVKLAEVRKIAGGYQPLLANAVHEEIQTCKKAEADVKVFNEGLLQDVQNQGKNILKDCPEDEKEHLQKLLDEINADYKLLRDETATKAKSLADLLNGRQNFEADVAKFSNWLNEADSASSGEIRTTNVQVLEEQLAKYQRLNDESAEMGKLLAAISEQGRAILPTLSNAEKLKLNDQLKSLKDRYNKITGNIQTKIRTIQDLIRKYKDDKAKLADCMQFLAGVQQEIRDLNKPVGSKIEDVQNLLSSYERILNDLKNSKAKMSDLQGLDHLPELQTILTQQDNLIKTIEDQLAHLRQLLLLREQFIALINQIIEFIVKYTSVITEIEKCPNSSIEDKITKYGDVIVKIQECEALLAAAGDKGQQIAAEGNAADQNAITEQLQSLKQQLQHLRKLVESQRQRHELTLAEHRKLAAELSELLDWLHANEGTAKSRPLLDRDPDCVEREIIKHEQFAADVHAYLEQVRRIHDGALHDVGIPGSLLEMISEGRSLMTSLPVELEERAKYLANSRANRIEYMGLVAKFNEWVHESEVRLQNGRHGVDFEHIASDLEEHKLFFSNETPVKELVTKQIQGTADRIWPSLNVIEQEELTRELQQFGQVMKNTLLAAKTQREQLERDAAAWKEYGQMGERVRSVLARATFDAGEPVKDLAGLQFSVQKITHALNDLQSQRSELNQLNERAQAILRQADPPNRERIEQQNAAINRDWAEQVARFEQRREQLTTLQLQWESYDNRVHAFENQVIRLEERARHVDPVVRSRRQLEDTKHVIQELLGESEQLKSTHQEVTNLSQSIIAFLGEVHESQSVIAVLQDKLDHITGQYKLVKDKLHGLDTKANADLDTIERHFAAISDLQDRINALLDAINDVYVYDADASHIESRLQELQTSTDTVIADSRGQITATQTAYQSAQQLVPADVTQELNALEQLAERLAGAMEAKQRDHKRAKTVRSEYLRGVDSVQQWLQQAELRIQDRSAAPLQLKETLNRIQQDLAGVQEQLDGVKANGAQIIERTRSDEEKQLVRSTIEQLQQQLGQVVAWLDEKRHQVGDTLDAWTRFMNLYQIVMTWAREKRTFVATPLRIQTLLEAKQHQQVYGQAVKGIKPIVANLSEMNRELDAITQVTQVGDLRAKLVEAEEAKGEVERELLERNAFLQETAEEWEQCERKLKDVRAWIDKTNALLDSVPHKKKPLRDQHGLCEKFLADTSIQKTKISMSVEKLQVHFRAGIGGDTKISETAAAIVNELEQLAETIRTKASSLEASLGQIEDYQRQQQQLRQKILKEEQQLRQVLAPTYLPHDRDRAVNEQQACRERVKMSQAKITAINERIKLIVHRGTPDNDPLET